MFAQLYPNLDKYIAKLNRMAAYSKEPVIDTREPMDIEVVKRIEVNLMGDLSPENLHCDGEISAEQAKQKYQHYMAVADEVTKLTGIPCYPEG
jgi:hypothetical protein